jgi:fructuronate reductase
MSPQPRLCAATLDRLPAGIARPGYDRRGLPVTVGHLGVGAFHRCHQAEYLDDLLAAGAARGGILGVNLRAPSVTDLLGEQDGLYLRTLSAGDDRDRRVIGSILRVRDAATDIGATVAALADPAITAITLTVTEKGYCHIPATGRLNESHDAVQADLAAWHQGQPRSVPGFLVAVLRARAQVPRAAQGDGRVAGVNLVSCDNIAANGQVLQAVVRAFAAAAEPDLLGWMDDHVAFPGTMVDRIVPATSGDDLAAAGHALGLADQGAVFGEPFRQWVIEDGFRAERPHWEAAGAEIVVDVAPYEMTKMRVLNAAQTLCAIYGALAGLQFTHEAVSDARIAAAVEATIRDETLPHLPRAPGMEPRAYLRQSLARIANRAISHGCHQIATDTSQKINQRVLQPIRARRAAGLPHPGLTRGIAAWIAYLARSAQAFGAAWAVSDPVADRVARVVEKVGRDLTALVAGVVGMEDVFGEALARDPGFRAEVVAALGPLLQAALPAATATLSRAGGPGRR